MRQLAILLIVALLAAYIPAEAQNGWVAIVSPTAGESISGKRAEVSISFNTGTSDKVTRVEIEIGGKQFGLKYLSEPDARGVVSFVVDTTSLSNESHNLVAKVYSGNRLVGSTSGSCLIGNAAIDVVPPSVSFGDIKADQEFSGVAEIEVTAEDASGDDCLVSLFIDRSLKLIKNSPPYTYAWDTTSAENGRHKLEATAFDSAGNKGDAESIDVIVENAGPKTLPAAPVAEQVKPLSVEKPAVENPAPEKIVAEAPKAAVQPQVPVERERRDTAARSVERPNIANSTAGTAPAKPRVSVPATEAPAKATPEVRAEVPAKVTAEASAQVPAEVPAEAPAKVVAATPAPKTTLPSADDVRQDSPKVVAALPADKPALVVAAQPTSGAPAVTSAKDVASKDATKVKSIEIKIKPVAKAAVVKPQAPQTKKPVRMARAPRPEAAKIQAAIEPKRMLRKIKMVRHKRHSFIGLRQAIEAAGGTIIAWDQKTHTVLAAVGGQTFKVKVGSMTATVAGRSHRLNTTPYVNSHGRTMVDVHFLQTLLGDRFEINQRMAQCLILDM